MDKDLPNVLLFSIYFNVLHLCYVTHIRKNVQKIIKTKKNNFYAVVKIFLGLVAPAIIESSFEYCPLNFSTGINNIKSLCNSEWLHPQKLLPTKVETEALHYSSSDTGESRDCQHVNSTGCG